MTVNRKVVKVFLASPGDLSDERKAAKSVVDEFNTEWADELGYQVEIVGWEDTVSVFGRPQATINREIERCELFVGLMWKKWGTPPDTVGKYSSGFEEEFRTSIERRSKDGRPEISLLFKEIGPEFLLDPGDDLKKVLAFRDQLAAEKTILFEKFSDLREFESKFRRSITKYVNGLRKKESGEVSALSQSPQTGVEQQQLGKERSSIVETPLSIEGAKFLRAFISKTEGGPEKRPFVPVEVARFRLLANIVGNQGNDEGSIGVHDANLLFTERGGFTFGYNELSGLLSCGFEHYSHQNAPLWRWVGALGGFTRKILPIHSIFESSTDGKVGALAAMRLISEPLPSDPPYDRKFYLDRWFAEESTGALKIAALAYLGDCGIRSDLPTLTREFERNDYQTSSAAADAIIRINLRGSRDTAISALYELQPTSISLKVLKTLFYNHESISTSTLLDGVSHQNSTVRRIVVELLCKRHSLPIPTAEQLLSDSDAKIRFEALKSLIDNGRAFSDEDAKKMLIKPAPTSLYGLSLAASDSAGESYWAELQFNRLRSLGNEELGVAATANPLLDPDPQFILAERQFKRRREGLRNSLDDQYKGDFTEALHRYSAQFGENADQILNQFRSLEDYLRRRRTRKGLDLICRKSDQSDLTRVRLVMKSGFVDYSSADIEYLKRFGGWEDIPLIIEAVKRPTFQNAVALLSIPDDLKYKTAARTMYSLGRARLPELLTLSMSSDLLSHLIVEIPHKAFCELSNAPINHLLRSPDESVRRATAIKCVRALPKMRLVKLLTKYVSSAEPHYYNVVHWLDFGASTPRNRAAAAAEKALIQE